MKGWFHGVLLACCVIALTWSVAKAANAADTVCPDDIDFSYATDASNFGDFQDHQCNYFRCIDVNCDGKAEISDFLNLYERIPPALKNDTRLLNIIGRQLELIGQFLKLFPLTNRNIVQALIKGPVTLQEFIDSMTRGRNTTKAKADIRQLVNFLHNTFSYERKDLALTKVDYRIIYCVFGIDLDWVDLGFEALDANNDGLIQICECYESALKYFLIADPNDPSQLWAGPVISCDNVRAKNCNPKIPLPSPY